MIQWKKILVNWLIFQILMLRYDIFNFQAFTIFKMHTTLHNIMQIKRTLYVCGGDVAYVLTYQCYCS